MIEKLLKIFGNYTRSLEILYLLNDIKKLVRLDANEVELKIIKEFCDKENLHLQVSDFKVVKIMDEGKGNYANIVKKVPLNYPDSGLYHIYISKDKNKSDFLKLLEYKNDDRAIGELLGYPQCCVDFFMDNKDKQQKIQNDYILPALNNSEGFEFPFYVNYAIRYFDITLLSHFPHSFNCKESIEIAKKNLQCIKKYSEESRRTTIRLRDSMEDDWYRWESHEYTSRHPLRRLDRHPKNWEKTREVAVELNKEEELTELVIQYRAEVGTRYLEDPKAVRVNDKKLEEIILGITQTS